MHFNYLLISEFFVTQRAIERNAVPRPCNAVVFLKSRFRRKYRLPLIRYAFSLIIYGKRLMEGISGRKKTERKLSSNIWDNLFAKSLDWSLALLKLKYKTESELRAWWLVGSNATKWTTRPFRTKVRPFDSTTDHHVSRNAIVDLGIGDRDFSII